MEIDNTKLEPKPIDPCPVCGSNDWWLLETFGPPNWVCSCCHPKPKKGGTMKEEVELIGNKFVVKGSKTEEVKITKQKVVPKQYSEEALVLRDRVVAGNKKLNDAWEVIKSIDYDSQEWNEEFDRWHLANERLSELCDQLKSKGYNDCLYIDKNGIKTKKCLEGSISIGCRVCPRRKNLMVYKGGDNKKLKHGSVEIAKYCSCRCGKAKTREAKLWWINRHYEVTSPDRYEEIRRSRGVK